MAGFGKAGHNYSYIYIFTVVNKEKYMSSYVCKFLAFLLSEFQHTVASNLLIYVMAQNNDSQSLQINT